MRVGIAAEPDRGGSTLTGSVTDDSHSFASGEPRRQPERFSGQGALRRTHHRRSGLAIPPGRSAGATLHGVLSAQDSRRRDGRGL